MKSVEWSGLRAVGDPGGLPGLVGRMLGAVDGESAREASGRIESNVCPNRMLYGAAEAVAAHIVSALGSGGVSPAGLLAALDLLVEIAYGQPSVIERIEGDESLARRCRGIIRRSLPVIYALGRADGGQRVRLAVVDLAGRLETSAAARRGLLEDFGRCRRTARWVRPWRGWRRAARCRSGPTPMRRSGVRGPWTCARSWGPRRTGSGG